MVLWVVQSRCEELISTIKNEEREIFTHLQFEMIMPLLASAAALIQCEVEIEGDRENERPER